MDWQDLEYFVCLVEERTLTACADKLNVQHSTVSRRIERLEKSLTLSLFDRMGKRYTLTQEGETLYEQAVEVQKEVTNFKRLAIDQNVMQGKVVISAPPVLANEVLIKYLPEFYKQYPNIVLQLGADLQFVDLHRKEADIALRLGRPTQEDLLIRTVSKVRYGFFAHKKYIDNTPAKEWALIEFNANTKFLAWMKALTDQHDYPIVFSSNDLYVVHSTVSQAMGIAILPYFLAHKNPDLVPINPLTRQIMMDDKIESATGYQLDSFNQSNQNDRNNQNKNDDHNKQKAIPLIQSQPLYTVIHPDVRRSARVKVVAEWLGSVLAD